MLIKADDRVVFTGDSITDCGRNRAKGDDLGFGYAALAAGHLQARLAAPELRIFNRGISGNRTADLLARIELDLFALRPTVVSILIGINDTWRRYDGNEATDAKSFERSYRSILEEIDSRVKARVVLLEPFLLPVPPDRFEWREDLNPKIDVVRQLATEFGAELLPLDGLFAQAATQAPAAFWAADGVHPTLAGHALIAETWLENAGIGCPGHSFIAMTDEAPAIDFIRYLKCDLPEGYPLEPPVTWPMTEPLRDGQRQDLARIEVELLVEAEKAALVEPSVGYLAALKHQILFEILPASALVYALVDWQKVINDSQRRWKELQRETRAEIDEPTAHFCERLANLQRNASRIAAAEKTLGVAMKAGFTALEPMPPKPGGAKSGLLGWLSPGKKSDASEAALRAWERQDSFQQICERAVNLIKTLPPETRRTGLRDLPGTLKVLAGLREERAALEETYITRRMG